MADGRPGLALAPAPAVLPRRRRRREPHALGPPARRQGLLRHGPAPARSSRRCAARSTSSPACSLQLQAYAERGADRPLPRRLAHAGRRPDARTTPATCSTTSSWPIADTMIRPFPRYRELYQRRGRWAATRPQRGAAPLPRARPPRPAGLVQPRLDPPARLRARRRSCAELRDQGPALHRGREEAGCSTSTCEILRRDHPAAPPARRRAARSS